MNMSEANRCILCKNARCQNACPINTNIPRVIALYKEGHLEEAKEILFENNPFSSVCSLVCDYNSQCYGHCIKGIKATINNVVTANNIFLFVNFILYFFSLSTD